MNTQALRPVPLADKYEAFVIGDKGRTYPLDSAGSLNECLALSSARVPHKGRFFIRHTDALSSKVMLSFYAMKKAKPTLRYHNYQHRMIADLYAEHLFYLAGDAL